MVRKGMILAYARFMREKYAHVIVSTLAVAIIVGLITPEPGIFIRKFSAPLIVIMIGAMGFTITFKSLGMAAKDWKCFSLMLTALTFYQIFLKAWGSDNAFKK